MSGLFYWYGLVSFLRICIWSRRRSFLSSLWRTLLLLRGPLLLLWPWWSLIALLFLQLRPGGLSWLLSLLLLYRRSNRSFLRCITLGLLLRRMASLLSALLLPSATLLLLAAFFICLFQASQADMAHYIYKLWLYFFWLG